MGVDIATYGARRNTVICGDKRQKNAIVTRSWRGKSASKVLSATNPNYMTEETSSCTHSCEIHVYSSNTWGFVPDNLSHEYSSGHSELHVSEQVRFSLEAKASHHAAVYLCRGGALALVNTSLLWIMQLLLLSGDVEINPGPAGKDSVDPTFTFKNIMNALKTVTEWKSLSTQLGISPNKIQEIDTNKNGIVADCKHAIIQFWMESDTSRSWKKLVDALTSIDQLVLAEEIRQTYILVSQDNTGKSNDGSKYEEIKGENNTGKSNNGSKYEEIKGESIREHRVIFGTAILMGCVAVLVFIIIIAPSATHRSTTVPSSVTGAISVIRHCVVPGTVAITFNDGPYNYTRQIAKNFTQAGGNVTFFLNGKNRNDCIYSYAKVIKEAYNAGHQIGSLTWSHANLTTLSEVEMRTQMNQLSTAFQRILGAVPVYMRPPYGSCNDTVNKLLESLGFKVVALWDVDPGDTQDDNTSRQIEVYNMLPETDVPYIVVHHETSTNTAKNVVPLIIDWAKKRNLKMVTLGECIGDLPANNWYTNYTTPEKANRSWGCETT